MARAVAQLVLATLLHLTTCLPLQSSQEQAPTNASVPRPQIYELRVRTDIRMRYARTLVSSRLANPADTAQEVVFHVTIPESAFISKFVMEVDGQVLEGVVKERQQAQQEYESAVQSGHSAGHVATTNVRDSEQVHISVNVGPRAKASFNLTYEELLVRRKGRYELAVNLRPGQVVREMSVDVHIRDKSNITDLKVPSFRSSNEVEAVPDSQPDNADAEVTWVSGRETHVHFAPSQEQQQRLGTEKRGLGGQFVVQYDVQREQGAGQVLALDGYFVHFFSPPDLPPLAKHVVFVLDVSGSMSYGSKMTQLREAMDTILQELRPSDFFNLIIFSSDVTLIDMLAPENSTVLQSSGFQYGDAKPAKFNKTLTSKVTAYPANPDLIAKARDVVRHMEADGGTNIHDAVESALHVAKNSVSLDDSSLPDPLIIFLTDGEATEGETRADNILKLIDKDNLDESKVSIFSLAFGADADLAFLKRLSLRAGAFARKIYEAADAALQLKDFYRQVASPLLSNVTFHYLDTQVDGSTVTKQKFGNLFSGSELVVAGKLRDENKNEKLNGAVQGHAGKKDVKFPLQDRILPTPGLVPTPKPLQPGDHFLERLWGFLTIKQLLDQYEAERQDDSKNQIASAVQAKQKALELALQYKFVTPVTSLIVVAKNNTASDKNSTHAAPIKLNVGSTDTSSSSNFFPNKGLSGPAPARPGVPGRPGYPQPPPTTGQFLADQGLHQPMKFNQVVVDSEQEECT